MNKFGLQKEDVSAIVNEIKNYSQIQKVIIYGSRANGKYKPGSDIDLTLFGNKLNYSTLLDFSIALDELFLPYKFDVSVFSFISNPDLINHILKVGQVFYVKQ